MGGWQTTKILREHLRARWRTKFGGPPGLERLSARALPRYRGNVLRCRSHHIVSMSDFACPKTILIDPRRNVVFFVGQADRRTKHCDMRKLSVALTALSIFLMSELSAEAVSFNFSFDNLFGDVPGTVTGRIDGLTDNSTSAATAVFVTSSPALLGYPLSASDNILSQPSVSILANSFSVTNGAMTAEDFQAGFTEANGDDIELLLKSAIPQFLLVRFATTGVNFDTITNTATFSPVSQVPLPASLPLLATGLGALGLLGWRRKKTAAG